MKTGGRLLVFSLKGMCRMFQCVTFMCFNFPTVGLHPSFTSSWKRNMLFIHFPSTKELFRLLSTPFSPEEKGEEMKRGGMERKRLTVIVYTSPWLQEASKTWGWNWIMADLRCQGNHSSSGPFRAWNKTSQQSSDWSLCLFSPSAFTATLLYLIELKWSNTVDSLLLWLAVHLSWDESFPKVQEFQSLLKYDAFPES